MYTQKKPIDNTHIVRERDRRRNRELLAVLSLGIPIGSFLLLFTWQNLEVIRLGRETTALQKTYKDTEAVHKALEAERDRLTSFDTVETQAAKLGFAPADPKTIVMVTTETSATSVAANPVAPAPAAPPVTSVAGGR
jgi:cell division protein FtsB